MTRSNGCVWSRNPESTLARAAAPHSQCATAASKSVVFVSNRIAQCHAWLRMAAGRIGKNMPATISLPQFSLQFKCWHKSTSVDPVTFDTRWLPYANAAVAPSPLRRRNTMSEELSLSYPWLSLMRFFVLRTVSASSFAAWIGPSKGPPGSSATTASCSVSFATCTVLRRVSVLIARAHAQQ